MGVDLAELTMLLGERPVIERYEGEAAVNFIRQLQQSRRELRDNCRVQLWYTDHDVSCYVLSENGRALSFALLSGCEGPRHKARRFINYIYTVEAQRNRGLATTLLRKIKLENEVTAVCWNDVSERIFYKTGYVIQEVANGNAVYSYP